MAGFFYPFNHTDGGLLFVREKALVSQPGVATLQPVGLGATLAL